MEERNRKIIDRFGKLYYSKFNDTWNNVSWLGHKMLKCPLDVWLYQELIHRIRPELIVETGTYQGGSAYYFASLFDLLGSGEVVTVDVDAFPERPIHPRISYLTGSSTSEEIVARVQAKGKDKKTVMVILDSDHTEPHVRRELELYAPMVTPGSYLVVEDTIVNGHPVFPEFGPGPMEAVEWFLGSTADFMVDRDFERHLLSFNKNGWLKRLDVGAD